MLDASNIVRRKIASHDEAWVLPMRLRPCAHPPRVLDLNTHQPLPATLFFGIFAKRTMLPFQFTMLLFCFPLHYLALLHLPLPPPLLSSFSHWGSLLAAQGQEKPRELDKWLRNFNHPLKSAHLEPPTFLDLLLLSITANWIVSNARRDLLIIQYTGGWHIYSSIVFNCKGPNYFVLRYLWLDTPSAIVGLTLAICESSCYGGIHIHILLSPRPRRPRSLYRLGCATRKQSRRARQWVTSIGSQHKALKAPFLNIC